MKRIFLFILTFGTFMVANAQKTSVQDPITAFYTIQLGAFEESIKQADFEAIRSYAYVYKRDGLVFVGNFTNEEAAEPILAKIKSKGFDDAFVATRSLKKSKTGYVIQIATKNAGEPINWKLYGRAGELFTMPNAAQVRIVHGFYDDKNDANVKLREIQSLGFDDAFIKSVKDVQLNPLTDFDTGDKNFVKTPTVIGKGVDPIKIYSSVPQGKRKSVVKLQETLGEIGNFDGNADGKFGKMTQTAFENSIKSNRRLKAFNELAQQYEGFEGWADVRLLMTITRELSIKNTVSPVIADLLNNLPDEALAANEATIALNWHTATWKKLDTWSTTSQYNDQIHAALKVAYYRSLVHLEDYFAAKGIRNEEGTALAVSVLKTLVAKDFDGF